MTALSVRPLNAREAALLNECEETIAAGIMTFAEVGEALLVVRDQKLFRRDFVTFEDYCVARWQISRQRAYQLMDAAALVSTIVDKGLPAPTNEAQARALAAVPEDALGKVWTTVHDRTDGKPTAAAIRAAAEDHRSATPAPVDGEADGGATPDAAEEVGRSSQSQVPASSDEAATADRVGPAVASPDTANRPGPADSSSAGATGAGSAPAPVADTPEEGAAEPNGSSTVKRHRRPLVDAFRDAASDLVKSAERVARLADDDRFPRNAEQVARISRHDLLRATDLLTTAVGRLSQLTTEATE
jgi:hypothetical protein